MNTNIPRPLPGSENAGVPAPDSVSADPAILRANLVALREQHLRLAADFENFRKRTRRHAEQQAATEKPEQETLWEQLAATSTFNPRNAS